MSTDSNARDAAGAKLFPAGVHATGHLAWSRTTCFMPSAPQLLVHQSRSTSNGTHRNDKWTEWKQLAADAP